MPSYRQRGAGRSTSPDRNVQGGGASLRGGGASLRGGRASARGGRASARGGGVSARGGGGASLRGGGLSFQGIDGSTVNDRPPPRPEPISYAQPENRPFVSVSESSVASDESTLLQPNGFKKVQQPLRSTSAASTESAEDEIIFTPRHGHTRARGSTLKAAISPYAGLGGGASLKVADDHASSSSGYATSVDEQAVQEKEKLKVGTSLATKSEPKPAQTPARRQGSLVDSGEATIAPLSAGTRVHQLSTQSRQVCSSLV
ncbi:hypothetical protein F5Y18DRAFT_127106 [Xylariaceae sp. FL1019]|nr:hypothetical protein F5Y18DRAFT_127106 [Xylariaceae sp. FL1019]